MSGALFASVGRDTRLRGMLRGIVAGLLLTLHPGSANAEWTGISLDLANTDSDWKFGAQTRQASNNELSFRIEERSAGGLAAGAGIGYFDMRLLGPTPAETLKFDGQYFNIFLRQDFTLSPRLSLHGGVGYKYASGSQSGDVTDGANIDWTETNAELGIGFRAANLRIMPFAGWSKLDGDLSAAGGTSVFSLDQSASQGVRLDIFTEQTAFVRLELVTGSRSGGMLVFARRY